MSCVSRSDGLLAVEAACQQALAQNVFSAPVIINILARSRDQTPPPLLLTSTALRLISSQVALCKCCHGLDPNRQDVPKLAQQAADHIGHLSALPNSQITRAMDRQDCLLFFGLDRQQA